jgi:hypothetical protein
MFLEVTILYLVVSVVGHHYLSLSLLQCVQFPCQLVEPGIDIQRICVFCLATLTAMYDRNVSSYQFLISMDRKFFKYSRTSIIRASINRATFGLGMK